MSTTNSTFTTAIVLTDELLVIGVNDLVPLILVLDFEENLLHLLTLCRHAVLLIITLKI